MNRRLAIIISALAAFPAFWMAAAEAGGYFGEPVFTMVPDWEKFRAGARQFARVWGEADGVGPKFNERSCLACHAVPMPGGAGLTTGTFVFVSALENDETGGHVFQRLQRSSDGVVEQYPPATSSRRKAPPLFGLGLLEKVPQEFLMQLRPGLDNIRGRPGGTPDRFGRFGWKASVPDLEHFVKTAFSVELGFGSKAQETSKHPALEMAMDQVTTFVAMLSPPPGKGDAMAAEQSGKVIFSEIGCAQCHLPTLSAKYVRDGTVVDFEINPYSDLLLHDMGPDLSDSISEGSAGGNDFRTPPLWGLTSFGPPYLHDGRAGSLSQAIAEHDGEARMTRLRWEALQDDERRSLLRFLATL